MMMMMLLMMTITLDLHRGGHTWEPGQGQMPPRVQSQPPFDSHSTAIRPRYDHSTTFVTTVVTAA